MSGNIEGLNHKKKQNMCNNGHNKSFKNAAIKCKYDRRMFYKNAKKRQSKTCGQNYLKYTRKWEYTKQTKSFFSSI